MRESGDLLKWRRPSLSGNRVHGHIPRGKTAAAEILPRLLRALSGAPADPYRQETPENTKNRQREELLVMKTMRKALPIVLALCMLPSLAGCAGGGISTATQTAEPAAQTQSEPAPAAPTEAPAPAP